jgi:hypothetical protein
MWSLFSPTDLAAQRSLAAQSFLMGSGRSGGFDQMKVYLQLLRERLMNFVAPFAQNLTVAINLTSLETGDNVALEAKELFLSLVLSEAQGSIRGLSIKATDLLLLDLPLPAVDGIMRFQLSLCLAKLGLFELSMKHSLFSVAPWEDPLINLRTMLMMAPVHASVRSLAAAVELFENQVEKILLDDAVPRTLSSRKSCESLDAIAIMLQVLPLLHLVGFSAPLHGFPLGESVKISEDSLLIGALGVSDISLSELLSEVYQHVCIIGKTVDPLLDKYLISDFPSSSAAEVDTVLGSEKLPTVKTKLIKIGVVSGSFDSFPGKIVIGLMESMSPKLRTSFQFAAMCFPTPRDFMTDRANALFDIHINLVASNKSTTLSRILEFEADFLLFADAALDSRVFALAHERLARFQGILWHWGGALGIPSADFYFMPEVFVFHTRCSQLQGGRVAPQNLFSEQMILLEGLPYLPYAAAAASGEEVKALLQSKYLLPITNQSHLYVFPGTARHLHPSFDRAIDVILRTDPSALIVFAVAKSVREAVPPTHHAVQHDLLHPAQPIASVAKCLRRIKSRVGEINVERVRFLPPIEEAILRGLQKIAVAVLDPFPVGSHWQVLQAFYDQVPVLSSFALQECTNSHAHNIARHFNISSSKNAASDEMYSESDNFLSLYPTTPEEYGVWAVRLHREPSFRQEFIVSLSKLKAQVSNSKSSSSSHGNQLLQFVKNLKV